MRSFQLVSGFNLNGIDATPNGKTLVVVQSATGKLFSVAPGTGATKEISLGGGKLAVELTATDGDGDTDSAQIDIGGSIKFEDDGPTVTVGTGTFSLAVDETVGGGPGDVDANGTNGTAQDGSAVENVAAFGR